MKLEQTWLYLNLTSMISDLFDEGSYGVSFVARKPGFAGQSQRLTTKMRVFMFSAVHQVLIKVNKYLVDHCK